MNTQNSKIISIQGWPGSFHHQAAINYFGSDIQIVPCATFFMAFEQLRNNKVDYALIAIENSIAGSIRDNFLLLKNFDIPVVGELYQRVDQNLLALPNVDINEITEIHSHPMALAQCSEFLSEYPQIAKIESIDTALSAKEIVEGNLKNKAAIAGKFAAELYNLTIIKPDIANNIHNYTRFLVLGKSEREQKTKNKSTINLILNHKPGTLSDVLGLIARNDLNLTKIESLPIPDQKWHYEFFIDIVYSNENQFYSVIKSITRISESIKILGLYNQGIEYSK